MDEQDKGRIEKLNDKLYSRTRYRDPLDKRHPVKELDPPAGGADIEEGWQTPELDEMLKHERVPPKVGLFMKKIFVLALLFFAAAIGISGFILSVAQILFLPRMSISACLVRLLYRPGTHLGLVLPSQIEITPILNLPLFQYNIRRVVAILTIPLNH